MEYLTKLQAFRPATVLERDFSHGCFPVKFTPILKNISELLTASVVSFSWLSLPHIVQAQTKIIEE